MPNAIGLSKLDVLAEITGWHGELRGSCQDGLLPALVSPASYGLLNLVLQPHLGWLR